MAGSQSPCLPKEKLDEEPTTSHLLRKTRIIGEGSDQWVDQCMSWKMRGIEDRAGVGSQLMERSEELK
jgi:hypothetical protein